MSCHEKAKSTSSSFSNRDPELLTEHVVDDRSHRLHRKGPEARHGADVAVHADERWGPGSEQQVGAPGIPDLSQPRIDFADNSDSFTRHEGPLQETGRRTGFEIIGFQRRHLFTCAHEIATLGHLDRGPRAEGQLRRQARPPRGAFPGGGRR